MKITIDTKEDSHLEIKKVITMLQHLVGETPLSNSPYERSGDTLSQNTEPSSELSGNPSEGQGAILGDMFDLSANSGVQSNDDNDNNPEPEEKSTDSESVSTGESIENISEQPQILPYDL